MAPCARWTLPFLTMPACIFHSVSPPVWSFWRWQRGIYHRVPAGRCHSSPCRRAFSVLYPRRHGRLAAGGGEFTTVCPPAVAVAHLAGVHFSFCIPAGMVVSPLAAGNLAPCARWSLPLFAMPACIFHPISPPASLSRRWRRRIWHRVPAGHCRCSPHRRAFFIPYPRRHDRFGAGGGEFGTVCPPAAAVARLTGVHFSFSIPAGMIVLALPAGIWHRVPAGRCRCSPCRRAFFVLYPRRYGRLAAGSEEFTTVCPPAVAVVRHAGVHFSFSIPAGMIVSPLAARNLPPCARRPLLTSPAGIFRFVSPPVWSSRLCRRGNLSPYARWSLPFLAMPACIFRFVSPPVRSSRRWRRRIWHRVPAGRCRCSPHRRAFFVLYPRRHGCLAAGDGEFGTVCPLVAAVVRHAGVHFSFCIPAGTVVSPLATENLAPCARRPLPLLTSPACIFRFVSPPVWSFWRCRRGIYHRVPARCSPHRRAFFVLYPRRHGCLAAGSGEFGTVCPLVVVVVRLTGVHFSFSIPAGMIVLALAAVNLPPCARWSLPLFAMPACIFHPISPPASLSRRWRRRIWHRVPAGHCRCSPHRRAFFVLYPRRHGRLRAGGGEFGTVCPLVAAVAHLAGVHFSFCIPAGMVVSPLAAENLAPCARWSLPLFASPACIFYPVSPPA